MPPLRAERGALRVRGRALVWGERTYIMGIVNVTPDSFSGDGVTEPQAAASRAFAQHEAGSDILDIGAESTRPGHVAIDPETEIERLAPVLRTVRERLPDAIVSADTYKKNVLRAAREAGADILNSVWGMPDELLEAAVEFRMPVVIMHNKDEAHYEGDVVDEVLRFLEASAARAVKAGIPAHEVILDPGIGFGKTADHNIAILRELPRLVALGFPTLVGTSRKSTIGKLTGREPEDRVYGTAATLALAVEAGIDMVRVHDVAAACDAVRVADAVVRDWRPSEWT